MNNWSCMPYVGTKGAIASRIISVILNNYMRDKGVVFENDNTLLLPNEFFVRTDHFQKVYTALYAVDLDYYNFNIAISLEGSPIYFRSPGYRTNMVLNELICIRWTMFSTTKVINVPLALFFLAAGVLKDVKNVYEVSISIPEHYDLSLLPDLFAYCKDFERFMSDVVTSENKVPEYPKDTLMFLQHNLGNLGMIYIVR